MYDYKSRYSILFKAIGWVLVCLFLVNDIAWASPPDPTPPQSAIAAQSRFKPFFEKHGLEFRDISTVVFVMSELKNLLATKKAREGRIYARIRSLNKLFLDGNVEIETKIKDGSFKCSGKGFKYAVMHFKKEKKTFKILFLEDHTALTAEELSELRIDDREKCHLDCPGLEGVWFIDTAPAEVKPKVALGGAAAVGPNIQEPQLQEEPASKAAEDEKLEEKPAVTPIPKNNLSRPRAIIYGIILGAFIALGAAQGTGMFLREKESSLQNTTHLATSINNGFRMIAAKNLRTEKAPEATNELYKLLRDGDSDVSAKALKSLLGEPKGSDATAAFIKALGDNNWNVRCAAATALKGTTDPGATKALIKALSDSNALVRLSAVKALKGTTDPEAVRALEKAIDDPDQAVQLFASDAFMRTTGRYKPAITPISTVITDPAKLKELLLVRLYYYDFSEEEKNMLRKSLLSIDKPIAQMILFNLIGKYSNRGSNAEPEFLLKLGLNYEEDEILDPDVSTEFFIRYIKGFSKDEAERTARGYLYCLLARNRDYKFRNTSEAENLLHLLRAGLLDKEEKEAARCFFANENSFSYNLYLNFEFDKPNILSWIFIYALLFPLLIAPFLVSIFSRLRQRSVTRNPASLGSVISRAIDDTWRFADPRGHIVLWLELNTLSAILFTYAGLGLLGVLNFSNIVAVASLTPIFSLGLYILFGGKNLDLYGTRALGRIIAGSNDPLDVISVIQDPAVKRKIVSLIEPDKRRIKEALERFISDVKDPHGIYKIRAQELLDLFKPPVKPRQSTGKGEILKRIAEEAGNDKNKVTRETEPKAPIEKVKITGEHANPALEEADRIHKENLNYTPDIPEKKILCHIITDSILPVEQRNMLRTLEKEMRADEYSEKVVCLSIDDQSKFIDELKALVARQRELYKDYSVEFDIACPNTELVNAVLGMNMGVKALAFRPAEDMAQVEGIILALRALYSGRIESLRIAFAILAGKELSTQELTISNINEFAKRITFILPTSKIMDYAAIRNLNDIIRKNIEAAA